MEKEGIIWSIIGIVISFLLGIFVSPFFLEIGYFIILMICASDSTNNYERNSVNDIYTQPINSSGLLSKTDINKGQRASVSYRAITTRSATGERKTKPVEKEEFNKISAERENKVSHRISTSASDREYEQEKKSRLQKSPLDEKNTINSLSKVLKNHIYLSKFFIQRKKSQIIPSQNPNNNSSPNTKDLIINSPIILYNQKKKHLYLFSKFISVPILKIQKFRITLQIICNNNQKIVKVLDVWDEKMMKLFKIAEIPFNFQEISINFEIGEYSWLYSYSNHNFLGYLFYPYRDHYLKMYWLFSENGYYLMPDYKKPIDIILYHDLKSKLETIYRNNSEDFFCSQIQSNIYLIESVPFDILTEFLTFLFPNKEYIHMFRNDLFNFAIVEGNEIIDDNSKISPLMIGGNVLIESNYIFNNTLKAGFRFYSKNSTENDIRWVHSNWDGKDPILFSIKDYISEDLGEFQLVILNQMDRINLISFTFRWIHELQLLVDETDRDIKFFLLNKEIAIKYNSQWYHSGRYQPCNICIDKNCKFCGCVDCLYTEKCLFQCWEQNYAHYDYIIQLKPDIYSSLIYLEIQQGNKQYTKVRIYLDKNWLPMSSEN